jgi:predicted unusual protein kinase regulating ubiquinone biosynthesis (AarF/ABC1/UbiB family)
VKLGQVLSSRADLLPEPYLKALARLQDSVKPFSYAEVEQIVESESGVRISKAFSRFDPEPIAGASLGQVHTAALRDGFEVVGQGAASRRREAVVDDFEVLGRSPRFLDKHTEIGRRHRFCEMLEELRVSIMYELNYEREAQSLIAMGENLAEFDLIVCRSRSWTSRTKQVLTMEHIDGRKITELRPSRGSRWTTSRSPTSFSRVPEAGPDRRPLPRRSARGQRVRHRGGAVALLDLGSSGHMTPSMQDHLVKILIAISRGQGRGGRRHRDAT